jgi:elongation factor 3
MCHTPAAYKGVASAIAFPTISGTVKALEPTFIESGLFAALLETVAVEAVHAYVADIYQ